MRYDSGYAAADCSMYNELALRMSEIMVLDNPHEFEYRIEIFQQPNYSYLPSHPFLSDLPSNLYSPPLQFRIHKTMPFPTFLKIALGNF